MSLFYRTKDLVELLCNGSILCCPVHAGEVVERADFDSLQGQVISRYGFYLRKLNKQGEALNASLIVSSLMVL